MAGGRHTGPGVPLWVRLDWITGEVALCFRVAAASDVDVACIQPKLALLRGMRDLVGPVERAWERAVAAGDTAHAEAEARKLAVIRSKLASFVAEALACVEVQAATTEVRGSLDVELVEVAEPEPMCSCNSPS